MESSKDDYDIVVQSFEKLGKFDFNKCDNKSFKHTEQFYIVFSLNFYIYKELYIGQLQDKHSKIYQGIGLSILKTGRIRMGFWMDSKPHGLCRTSFVIYHSNPMGNS